MLFINLNFIPHFPFFEKIAIADKFVILAHCQFEKNGFQNRCKIGNDWLTNPVESGVCAIGEKKYTNGEMLLETNMLWILAICKTLSIDTNKIVIDEPTESTGTARIIEICKKHKADAYLTNPDAFTKYLDADRFFDESITIMPLKSLYKKPIFEMLIENGISGTREIIKKTVKRHRQFSGGLVKV